MGHRSGKFVNAIDHFSEPVDRLRAALDASCVVGTWDWDITRGSMIYDAGAAQLLTGDASLANQEIYGMDTVSAVHQQITNGSSNMSSEQCERAV